MQNRVFIPQEALDQWLLDERIDLSGTELTVRAEGRRYRLAEAMCVLREVSGAGDPHELVGRVKSKPFLEELGAEIFERSMLVGDYAYDVVPGWLAVPVGSFEEHAAERDRRRDQGFLRGAEDVKTDEDLLSHHLLRAV